MLNVMLNCQNRNLGQSRLIHERYRRFCVKGIHTNDITACTDFVLKHIELRPFLGICIWRNAWNRPQNIYGNAEFVSRGLGPVFHENIFRARHGTQQYGNFNIFRLDGLRCARCAEHPGEQET